MRSWLPAFQARLESAQHELVCSSESGTSVSTNSASTPPARPTSSRLVSSCAKLPSTSAALRCTDRWREPHSSTRGAIPA